MLSLCSTAILFCKRKKRRNSVMWWSRRANSKNAAGRGVGCWLLGQHTPSARQSDDRRAAFEEYRNEMLRRADQDEREFREFTTRLRRVQLQNLSLINS